MSYYPNFHQYEYAAAFWPPPNNYYQNQGFQQHDVYADMNMMGSHMMSGVGGKATETKPRLAKDEVEKLESVFQKNNKPNSSLKKQLAEEMRVDIARINNWFQNRRAKAKQEKRHALNEEKERQKSEQDAETRDTTADTVKEYYASNDQEEDLRPSAAPFPPVRASAETTLVTASPPVEETEPETEMEEMVHATAEETEAEYTSPESPNCPAQDINISYSLTNDNFFPETCDYATSLPSEAASQAPCLTISIPQFMTEITDPTSASSYQHLPGSTDLGGMASHYMTSMPDSLHVDIKQEQMQSEGVTGFDQFSPESMAHSPPEITTTDFRFRPPPTIDIASRRNSKRPAQLVSCMRSQSYNFSGPKTGIEMSRRIEAPSPMRRVASATGNFPRGIQKATSAGPRSPLCFDRNQENLLLQMAGHSPVSRSSVAPPTPNTPVVPTQQQHMREATVSSMSSEDEKSYSVQTNLTVPQYAMDPTMRTPPDTPGLMTNMSGSLFPYDYQVPDEPLHTPSFGTFDNEFALQTNVPTYVAQGCGSQPVTPSFAPNPMGPAFYSSFGGGNTEYNWSDASSMAIKPSPEQTSSKHYAFNNITAQDFRRE
ncbi:homeobox transcription [Colletotrichum kahawae]|uniref:Homeobox transcription n=1 Tax=Colletotrichum kahawae TaxID=34407 RepID=A0AAD9YR30_COLKA|nr:homeobox transcription [Colletotrichum kahawae]